MRMRSFRPEAPVCLEDRALQSGFPHPVVLRERQLVFYLNHMRDGFLLFSRYHDLIQLHSEIDDVVVDIPFQRLDGLDVKIDGIVDNMEQQIRAHVPNAIRTASREAGTAMIAEVQSRVRTGDVVVR